MPVMSVRAGMPVAVASLVLSILAAACTTIGVPTLPPIDQPTSATAPAVSPTVASPTMEPTVAPTATAATDAPTTIASTAPDTSAPATQPPVTEPPPSVAATSGPEVINPGVLAVCMSFNRTRFAERDASGNPIGAEVELAQALADAMGLTPEISEIDFGLLIDAVLNSGCDVSMSGQFITQARLERIDMIPYREGVPHVVVPIGNPLGIHELTDLCGHSFAVVAGTVYVDMVQGTGDFAGTGLNDQCEQASSEPVDLHEYVDQQGAEDAISAGDVDAYSGNDFIVRDRPGEFVWAVELPRIRNGIGHRLDSPVLDESLRAALRQLIDDGTYLQILESHGIQELALTIRP